ncbi:MAG: prepilin-type N-terminal cleavage/methylation domain-containing protein [Pirellulaceae bacterium]|nr:prepilin-type N-terminal cleavage/methylation domain-containing protein [Pirellulaceae bacterium]
MTRAAKLGFTFIEVLASVAVVSALLLVTTQMLVVVAEQTRRSQRRMTANEVAASAMEIVAAQPYSQLDAKLMERPLLQELFLEIGQDWQLDLEVEPVNDPAIGKRLELAVIHRLPFSTEKPVVLTAWRFKKN